jgi:hypothetical protein
MEELRFPTLDYYLDESDPDVVIVRRQDGSFVAVFSAGGATKDGILEAAKEDRRKWLPPRAIDALCATAPGELKVRRTRHGGR